MAKPVKRRVAPGTLGAGDAEGRRGDAGPADARGVGPLHAADPQGDAGQPDVGARPDVRACSALGIAVILLNYVSLLPTWGFLPDDTSNIWLLVGLGLILAGIVVATQWH